MSVQEKGTPFEKREVGDDVFLRVLAEAVDCLQRKDIPYVVIGGIPSAVLGRPRGTVDADLFVSMENAERALATLAEADFQTQQTEPQWLYKGAKEGVVVDIIFRAEGEVYLDEEMIARSRIQDYKGLPLRMIPAEDLLVSKAVATEEDTSRYWYDALAILARSELDWDYLVKRAKQYGARRVLSLLLYGESIDLIVPLEVVRSLFKAIYDPDKPEGNR